VDRSLAEECTWLQAENARLQAEVERLTQHCDKADFDYVQVEAYVTQLRRVARLAHQFAIWMQITEWYAISPKVKKALGALEAEAGAALAEGDREWPTRPHPAPVVSAAVPPPTTATIPREEYLTTVAAIAQRLSERPEGVQQNSQTTTNEPSPSAELICSCDTGESGCACSKG
jgi:hypothetical protein